MSTEMLGQRGWIGVDFDGTLATYGKWGGIESLGDPVPKMVARVRQCLAEGKEVRIMTARVSRPGMEGEQAAVAIRRWCQQHIGVALPVTCRKDFAMIELWDDRAVQVIPNTGERADGK
jgi:hypothetical protein